MEKEREEEKQTAIFHPDIRSDHATMRLFLPASKRLKTAGSISRSTKTAMIKAIAVTIPKWTFGRNWLKTKIIKAELKIKVVKMNIDESPQTPGKYGVRAIPTVLAFQNGQVVQQLQGARPKAAFEEMVDALL